MKQLLDVLGDKFLVGDDCWPWVASCKPEGYGQLRWDGTTRYAHRMVYELFKGPVEGLELDHLCKNRWCVRPDHLEPVTHRENLMRGDHPYNLQARRTHCKNNHEFTEANTRWRGRARVCIACVRDRSEVQTAKRRIK